MSEPTLLRVAEVVAQASRVRASGEIKCETGCDESVAMAWIKHFEACPWSWPFTPQDEQALQKIDAAFMHLEKPEHFTNYLHCDECDCHDRTLLARNRETLRRKDLGSPGWDPMSFTKEEGIGYLFPALARFSLMPNGENGWYGDQLLWHLSWEGQDNRFFSWCSEEQRSAVASFLKHLSATRSSLVLRRCAQKNWMTQFQFGDK